MGVGQEECVGNDRLHTPPRKIHCQFHKHKHTSLVLLAGEVTGLDVSAFVPIVLLSVGGVSALVFRAYC